MIQTYNQVSVLCSDGKVVNLRVWICIHTLLVKSGHQCLVVVRVSISPMNILKCSLWIYSTTKVMLILSVTYRTSSQHSLERVVAFHFSLFSTPQKPLFLFTEEVIQQCSAICIGIFSRNTKIDSIDLD